MHICAGTASQELVAPFGLRLPIMPVKGYSLTVDIDDEAAAPSLLTDLSHRLVISRLGQRLPVADMPKLGSLMALTCTHQIHRARACRPCFLMWHNLHKVQLGQVCGQ